MTGEARDNFREVLELRPNWKLSEGLSPKGRAAGKRAAARRSVGTLTKFVKSLHKVTAVTTQSPLWVMLDLKVGKVPTLIDTGAQFSCVRSEVVEYLYLIGESCEFLSCSVLCTLADGTLCRVKDAVKLHVKLLKFAWDQQFKILKGCPFPVILGLDILRRTQMILDVSSKRYSFGFAPNCSGEFCSRFGNHQGESPNIVAVLHEMKKKGVVFVKRSVMQRLSH